MSSTAKVFGSVGLVDQDITVRVLQDLMKSALDAPYIRLHQTLEAPAPQNVKTLIQVRNAPSIYPILE